MAPGRFTGGCQMPPAGFSINIRQKSGNGPIWMPFEYVLDLTEANLTPLGTHGARIAAGRVTGGCRMLRAGRLNIGQKSGNCRIGMRFEAFCRARSAASNWSREPKR